MRNFNFYAVKSQLCINCQEFAIYIYTYIFFFEVILFFVPESSDMSNKIMKNEMIGLQGFSLFLSLFAIF